MAKITVASQATIAIALSFMLTSDLLFDGVEENSVLTLELLVEISNFSTLYVNQMLKTLVSIL